MAGWILLAIMIGYPAACFWALGGEGYPRSKLAEFVGYVLIYGPVTTAMVYFFWTLL